VILSSSSSSSSLLLLFHFVTVKVSIQLLVKTSEYLFMCMSSYLVLLNVVHQYH